MLDFILAILISGGVIWAIERIIRATERRSSELSSHPESSSPIEVGTSTAADPPPVLCQDQDRARVESIRNSEDWSQEHQEFLTTVAERSSEVDSAIKEAKIEHISFLEARYREDLDRKHRLSEFAKSSRLDTALIDVWEELRRYSIEGSSRRKIPCVLVSRTGADGGESVEIRYRDSTYSFSRGEKIYDEESGSQFSIHLHENGREKFAISCSEQYGEWINKVSCFDISALHMTGNWAKDLLSMSELIGIEAAKRSAEFAYLGAERISGKFSE